VGYTAPTGSRVGFGALLLAREGDDGALEYVGRVGSGYGAEVLRGLHEELKALRQDEAPVSLPSHTALRERHVTWVRPELVVEVKFRGWGREGLLRQASFLRVRDDKRRVEAPSRKPRTSRAAAKRPEAKRATADVRISSPERVVFAGKGITKGQVADFYRAVGEFILPWVGGRPLSLLRCPDGAGGECFFQKNHRGALGGSVDRVALSKKRGEQASYIAIHDVAGLLDLVQMNVLEFHPWGSTVEHLEHPDTLVFDLDPGPGLGWKDILA